MILLSNQGLHYSVSLFYYVLIMLLLSPAPFYPSQYSKQDSSSSAVVLPVLSIWSKLLFSFGTGVLFSAVLLGFGVCLSHHSRIVWGAFAFTTFSVLSGIVFFKEALNYYSLAGTVVIMIGSLVALRFTI